MGCCFSGSRRSPTGYVPDDEDIEGCSLSRCLCCLCCFCVYPCLPFKGYGGYPTPLRELEDFNATQDNLDQDNIDAYHQLQVTRVQYQEPIALYWDDIFDQLQTGDLVLFRGSSIGSVVITAFTGRWSHVGMVHVTSSGGVKKILLWESVSHKDGCLDVSNGKPIEKDGVRLVDLRKRLLRSDSPFFGIVKLKAPRNMRPLIQRRFEYFRTEEIHKPYEPSHLVLARAGLDCGLLGHNEHTRDSYFCSKLVCETYEYLTIVDKAVNSARVVPTDFWDYRLPMKNGVYVQTLILMPRLKQDSFGAGLEESGSGQDQFDELLQHDQTLNSPLLAQMPLKQPARPPAKKEAHGYVVSRPRDPFKQH